MNLHFGCKFYAQQTSEFAHKRVIWCKAALENEGWCWQSDLSSIEAREIVEAWRQEEDDRRRLGLNVVEYGIRKGHIEGGDIWEAYII